MIDSGALSHEVDLVTKGGWDHGTFRIGEHTVPYLNEYMAIEGGGPGCYLPRYYFYSAQ